MQDKIGLSCIARRYGFFVDICITISVRKHAEYDLLVLGDLGLHMICVFVV